MYVICWNENWLPANWSRINWSDVRIFFILASWKTWVVRWVYFKHLTTLSFTLREVIISTHQERRPPFLLIASDWLLSYMFGWCKKIICHRAIVYFIGCTSPTLHKGRLALPSNWFVIARCPALLSQPALMSRDMRCTHIQIKF